MGGGGGGNDSYERKQQAIEDKKQAARDALNAQFGIGQDVGQKAAPTRADFSTAGSSSGGSISRAINQVLGDKDFATATESYEANKDGTPVADARAAREALYGSVRDNAFSAGKRALDEQKDVAARKNKFELFARGLNGGSEDIDQSALLGRTYDQGLMDLGAKADAAKAQFRGDDESARLGLLQAIDSGADQGSAISGAVNQMQVNADRAAATAKGTALGDLFSGADLLYNKSRAAQGTAAGTEWWNQLQNGASKSPTARTGLITPTA